jgi:hypothetical protein
MKYTRLLFKPVLGLLLAAAGLFAAGQASAQSFTDHTKIRPLTGKITIKVADIPGCPTGQVLSGGSCTAVSSMVQGADQPSGALIGFYRSSSFESCPTGYVTWSIDTLIEEDGTVFYGYTCRKI